MLEAFRVDELVLQLSLESGARLMVIGMGNCKTAKGLMTKVWVETTLERGSTLTGLRVLFIVSVVLGRFARV